MSFAQATLRGQLVDNSEKAPIEFASVALYDSGDSSLVAGVVSGAQGFFEMNNLKSGSYYLIAQFMGFDTHITTNISLSKNQTLVIESIIMSANQKLLDDVVVSGERVTAMHKIDRQVFDATAFHASQGGTATDVLRNLPSITVNAQGEISARGATGFMVLLNGKPVQSDAATLLGQIPANSIENIEVITAPSAKYDPEGKAGIINITTKKGALDGFFAQVNIKVGAPSIENYDNADYAHRHGLDFTLNYRKDKWDLSAGASYLINDLAGRRVGDVYTITNDTTTRFPSKGERSFDEINYSGRFTLGYAATPNDQFSMGFFAGKRSKDRTADILYYDNHATYGGNRIYSTEYFNENLRIRTSDFALGSFDYAHSFSDKSKLSTSFLYEYTLLGGPTTNLNLAYPETGTFLQEEYNTNENPLYGIRFLANYELKPLSFGTVEVGYQFRNLNHLGDFVYERKNNTTGEFELIPDFSSEVDLRRQIHSGYGMLSGKKDQWSYTAGMRIEWMNREMDLKDKAGSIDTTYHYEFTKLYPSANVQYAVNDNLKIKAAYSRRVERTTTFKMNPFPEREHSETLEQGDPELKPEFIDLVELGIIKDFRDNSVYATAYFRNVKNLVNRVNTIYNDTILNRIYSNVGIGRSFGMELGAELNPASWWKIFAGGNLYHFDIDGSFADRPVNTSSWIHSINANTVFDLSNSFSVQWSVNYISRKITAQGADSKYLSPNLILRKTFMDDRLTTTIQWLNMDLGLLKTNEQRITTFQTGEFYTTTNYIYEVDMIMVNISYLINKSNNKARFIKSEFGEKEF